MHWEESCSVDITLIVERLNVITNSVKALRELRPLTYDEFATFARYVSEWLQIHVEEGE